MPACSPNKHSLVPDPIDMRNIEDWYLLIHRPLETASWAPPGNAMATMKLSNQSTMSTLRHLFESLYG